MSFTTAASTISSLVGAEEATALITTFTPPPQCTDTARMFDMLSSPYYYVWASEPMPVSSSTITSCYPSEWIITYSTAPSYSSVVPAMCPLVCPLSWETVMTAPGDYMACCPPSYSANNPSTTVDAYRPFYGGTCYLNLVSGQVLQITQYKNASISATRPWAVTVTDGQAYAHPTDGYAYRAQETVFVTGPNSSMASTSFATPIKDTSTSSPDDSSSGAIAGIVVSMCAAVALFAALLFFLFQRRRKSRQIPASELPGQKNGGEDSEAVTESSFLDSRPLHEIDSNERMELPYSKADANANISEMPSPDERPEGFEGRDLVELEAGHVRNLGDRYVVPRDMEA